VLPEARPIALRGDYYRLLGVLENASGPEIRRADRRLARQHHPDLSDHNGAADRFNAVSEAYQVLRDPDQRARYDRYQLSTGAVDRQPDSAERPRDSGYPRDGAAFGAGRFARHPGWRRVVASGRDVEATLELSPQGGRTRRDHRGDADRHARQYDCVTGRHRARAADLPSGR
jgi:curved DNA-binding protein CbpA